MSNIIRLGRETIDRVKSDKPEQYRPRVYLSGPDVFRKNAKLFGDLMKSLCAENGLTGVFPTDDPIREQPKAQSPAMFIRNRCFQHMHECEAMIANISPFRGPNADDGTAYEIGIMDHMGKPVVIYSNFADKTLRERYEPNRVDDWTCEDFDLTANLMLCAGRRVYENAGQAVLAMRKELLGT